MALRLKLTRLEADPINYQYVGAYRLRIEASDPSNSGAPTDVFIWHQLPVNPFTEEADERCIAVCSPADIAEYPVGAPDPDATYPFFRRDYLEFDLRSRSLVNSVWTAVMQAVDQLLNGLELLEELEVQQEVWIGGEPDSGDSDSESSS